MINHGGNSNPEFITFMHEECSVAVANGYAKIEGKPALVCAHGTVGIQHAAMAIYNAYCDQAPVFVVAGNISDAAERRGRVEWLHAAQDVAATVRDYTKWDDNPASLAHFGESAVRGYQIAMTAPMMPVVLAADGVLQEGEAPKEFDWRVPKLPKISQPSGDSAAVAELAQMLVAAENPVIVTSRSARTPAGVTLLVELAETLGAAVIDQQRRMNFPSRHPLNQTLRQRGAIGDADVILGLEVYDFFGVVHTLGGQTRRHPAIHHQAGNQAGQHQFLRPLLQEQLSKLPALRGRRSIHSRRCGSDAACVDRSREAPAHRRSQAGHSGPRRQARASEPTGARIKPAPRLRTLGMPARFPPRA